MKGRTGLCLLLLLSASAAMGGGFPTLLATMNTGHYPESLVVYDGTNIAVANALDNTITVFVGSCSGYPTCSYTAKGPWPVGAGPTSIDKGHFRGPGSPFDLVTANNFDNTVSVLLNMGGGKFQAIAPDVSAGPSPMTVVVGDFNGDGFDDIAVTNGTGAAPSVTVLLNDGNCAYPPPITPCKPTFGTKSSYPLPGSNLPWGLAKGNFTGGGDLDLVVANYYSGGFGAYGAHVLLNTGSLPDSLWASSTTPAAIAGPDSPVELGVKFKSDVDGYITAIRFYKGAGNTGPHVGNLWNSSGNLLATANFTSETASGWQQVNFSTPVPISANTLYIASYHTNVGHYGFDVNYFAAAWNRSPLHAPASASTGGNGVYAYGASSTFPNNTFNATNYWVDVVFSVQSTPGFAAAVAYPGGFYAPYVATGHFTGSSQTTDDFAITNLGGWVRIFTNNGLGSFTLSSKPSAGFWPAGIANAGDLDGDGIDDLVVTNFATGQITVLYSKGGYTPSVPTSVGTSTSYPYAVVVDKLDSTVPLVAVVNRGENKLKIYGP